MTNLEKLVEEYATTPRNEKTRKKIAEGQVPPLTLEEFDKMIADFKEGPKVSSCEEINRPDMPASVLTGILGRVCRERLSEFACAYSWLAVVSAASVLVTPHADPKLRCNIYFAPVGPVGSGKTEAQNRANILFHLAFFKLLDPTQYGSSEGMLASIGNREGVPLLWNVDELSHMLTKAQIEHAGFPFVPNGLFYEDVLKSTMAKQKATSCCVRLSIAGGVVDENFGDSFGAISTGGLYDRFYFGLCPSGYKYSYTPMMGGPLEFDEIGIDEQKCLRIAH